MNEEQEIKISDPTNQGGGVFFSPMFMAFSSPLFLTLCILVSTVAGVSLISGSINVIYVLITIGAWMTYASALKGELNRSGLAMISGTTKAVKIIFIVAGAILIVCSIMIAALSGSAIQEMLKDGEIKSFADLFKSGTGNYLDVSIKASGLDTFIAELDAALKESGVPIGALLEAFLFGISIGLFVGGALMLVMAFTFYRTLHKFHKSVCLNAKYGTSEIKSAKAAKVWLLVLGILGAIGALSTPISVALLPHLANAGVYIVGYVFISRHFS